MVVVGSLDPYWRHKQLQNMGNAVANAIDYANDAKEKKRAKVRAEFQEAIELGEIDPEAGMMAINDLDNRYKDKLLDNAVPERNAYRALMAKKVEKGEPMVAAWKKFSTAMNNRQEQIMELAEDLKTIPQTVAADPMQMSPEDYQMQLQRYASGDPGAFQQPNPEYAEKAKLLEQMSNPDLIGQAAYGELNAQERIPFQQYAHENNIDMATMYGLVDRSKLSQDVKGVMAVQGGQIKGDAATAALAGAEIIRSPADEAKSQLDFLMETYRQTGRSDLQTQRSEDQSSLQSQRTADQRSLQEQRAADSLTLKKTAPGKAADSGDGKEATDESRSWDSVLADRKEVSKGKYPMSTDTQVQLKGLLQEAMKRFPDKGEGAHSDLIVDIYEESYNSASGRDANAREQAALSAVLEKFGGGTR